MDGNKIVVLAPTQTRLFLGDESRARAFEVAFRVTMSPHEWTWTNDEASDMARYVLWATQRLDAIAQLVSDKDLKHLPEN